MTVNIHGKEYVTVAERVTAVHAETKVEITTEIVSEDERQVTVKATVLIINDTGAPISYTGHARSRKDGNGIEGQSPLEVAETSAVGRALGFAGYGAVESIASAEEVLVAQRREERSDFTPTEFTPKCPHGQREWRTGTSKDGIPWRGWFCPKKVKECKPVWIKTGPNPTQLTQAELDAEIPFE